MGKSKLCWTQWNLMELAKWTPIEFFYNNSLSWRNLEPLMEWNDWMDCENNKWEREFFYFHNGPEFVLDSTASNWFSSTTIFWWLFQRKPRCGMSYSSVTGRVTCVKSSQLRNAWRILYIYGPAWKGSPCAVSTKVFNCCALLGHKPRTTLGCNTSQYEILVAWQYQMTSEEVVVDRLTKCQTEQFFKFILFVMNTLAESNGDHWVQLSYFNYLSGQMWAQVSSHCLRGDFAYCTRFYHFRGVFREPTPPATHSLERTYENAIYWVFLCRETSSTRDYSPISATSFHLFGLQVEKSSSRYWKIGGCYRGHGAKWTTNLLRLSCIDELRCSVR